MYSVDDRFVSLLGDNCRQLQTVNFNGCRYVSDKGLAHLARRCPLKEVRIRGTACTDKSLYLLAQFCPELEWISHADFSGELKLNWSNKNRVEPPIKLKLKLKEPPKLYQSAGTNSSLDCQMGPATKRAGCCFGAQFLSRFWEFFKGEKRWIQLYQGEIRTSPSKLSIPYKNWVAYDI